jgi:hypothetical protein
LGTDLHFYLFAVDRKGFGLQIRLPHFFSVALRKADIIAVLLTFIIEFKSLHNYCLKFQGVILPFIEVKVNRLRYT